MWTLFKINDPQADLELVTYPEHKATVTFDGTRYGGSTGFNEYGGTVNHINENLFFSDLAVTEKYAVSEEKRLVEKYILECLFGNASYTIVQDTLKVTTQKGLILSFF